MVMMLLGPSSPSHELSSSLLLFDSSFIAVGFITLLVVSLTTWYWVHTNKNKTLHSKVKVNFLETLPPHVLDCVLSALPISAVLNASSTSKRIKSKLDANTTWNYLFFTTFLNTTITENTQLNWKEKYKEYFNAHPLSAELKVEPCVVAFGDEVKITFSLKNYRHIPLVVIAGNNSIGCDDFTSGRVLRTKQHKKDGVKGKTVRPLSTRFLCGTNSVSIPLQIDKQLDITIWGKVTIGNQFCFNYSNKVGVMIVNEDLSYFLPLVEGENKVWADFQSDGICRGIKLFKAAKCWNGSVTSNEAIIWLKKSEEGSTTKQSHKRASVVTLKELEQWIESNSGAKQL